MAGLLGDADASDAALQADPRLFLGAAASEDATPPDAGAAPAAAPAGSSGGPGFWDRLATGIGQAGMVLAGGDPMLTTLSPEQQRAAGIRSLLSASLSMLANSGPSYTPRSFGQILAAGLESAGQVPLQMEHLVGAQQAQQTELALKRGQLGIEAMTAKARLAQLQLLRDQIKAGQTAVDRALGGAGGTGAAGDGGKGPSILTPYVAPNLPEGVTPAEDQIVRTVIGEAAGEGETGQQAVAGVIKNRMTAGQQSAQDVIFTPNAFEPWNTGRRKELEAIDPASPQYQAVLNNVVRPVMSGKVADPTNGATHFLNPDLVKSRGAAIPDWAAGQPVATIGHHQFFSPGYGPATRPVQVAGPGAPTAAAAPPAPVPVGNLGLVRYPDGSVGTPAAGGLAAAPGPPAQPPAPGASQEPPGPPATPAAPPAAMAAPDTPEIAAARQKLQATRTAQLQALRGLQEPGTADKVNQIELDYQKGQAALDAEARAQQDKISTERRAEEAKQREDARKQQQAIELEQRKNDLQLAREREMERLKATNTANQSYQTAALNLDTKRLEAFGTRADAGNNMMRDTQALRQIAVGMGPANKLLDTDAGKQIRDMLVTLKLGSPETLANMTQSQAWDRMIGGLFGDTHVQGLGNQTDREGEWLMNAWGGASQNPIDRLTQLAIVRKLAEERVKDNTDAQRLFRGPGRSLDGLEEKIAQRRSLFDRPTAPPTDTAAQEKYNASHPPGEPYYAYWEVGKKGSGNWQQFWTRNLLDKNPATGLRMEHLSADVSGG
jgi:Cell Wall Hydrolase